MVARDRVFMKGRIAQDANATAPGISGGCACTSAADHSNSFTVSGVFVYSGLAGTSTFPLRAVYALRYRVSGMPCATVLGGRGFEHGTWRV
jgi:hypothetical protein